MRRLIKEEFGHTVHLDRPDAPETLLEFASRSASPVAKEMAFELKQMLEAPGAPEARSTTAAEPTYYRGAPLPRREDQVTASEKKPTIRGTIKRVYRGRMLD